MSFNLVFPATTSNQFEHERNKYLVNGVNVNVSHVNATAEDSIFLVADAPDGLDKADGTGRFADLAEAISEGGTELSASVINRQDFCFLEVWHEKVSDKDIVVPLGNVQYGATTWEGISLSLLTSLGVEQGYSAFGEWDTDTQGNGVQWSTLSDEDKLTFIQDPENNIYLEDGELIQVRYRIRTIAGLEGDWLTRSPHNATDVGYLGFNTQNRVLIQGTSETPLTFTNIHSDGTYRTNGANDAATLDSADVGIWIGTDGGNATSKAHNGLCFAVPICMVSRHNQGVFSPEFNSRAADRLTGDQFWHENPTALTSVADCFDPAKKAGKGDIASGVSGRDDGQYWDAVYSAYVQDLRVRADEKPEDEIREMYHRKAIANEVRGWEGVPFTKVTEWTSGGTNTQGRLVGVGDFKNYLDTEYGDSSTKKGIIVTISGAFTAITDIRSGTVLNLNASTAVEAVSRLTDSGERAKEWLDQYFAFGTTDAMHSAVNHSIASLTLQSGSSSNASPQSIHDFDTEFAAGNKFWFVEIAEVVQARAQKHTLTDCIGDPERIAGTFPNGGYFQWIPQIPENRSDQFWKFNRKAKYSDFIRTWTFNDGDSWDSDSQTLDTVTNGYATTISLNMVQLTIYTTSAHFTVDSVNKEAISIGKPTSGMQHTVENGALLCSSLIGKVPTSSTGKLNNDDMGGLKIDLVENELIVTDNDHKVSHDATTLSAPNNDGPGWKTLSSLNETNGKYGLQLTYKEMGHTTSWGDNSEFSYVDNQTTEVDDNGTTILVGTGELQDHIVQYFRPTHKEG